MKSERGKNDLDLQRRADAVLPSLTHLSIKMLPSGYSQFFQRAKGCRVTDVDQKEYIDYMASYGPILLGHQDEGVDNAVRAQMKLGNCMEGPSERMVELAELLTEVVPQASWAYFAKNGSDATSIAVRIARAHTRKRIILRAPASYHGAVPVFKEGPSELLIKEGILGEERAYQLPYRFNDIESVREAVEAAGDDLAGIICAAFKWDYGVEQELPTDEFLRTLRQVCDEKGAVLICDDVRSSMRLSLSGAWSYSGNHGVVPDVSCMCKGIANGYELSAIVGRQPFRRSVERVVATGSFWCNAIPFTAAIQTIKTLRDDPSIHQRMESLGTLLRNGLDRIAKEVGIRDFQQTGPVQMPYFSFATEADKPIPDRRKIQLFCSVCASLGIWFHPYHTMFLTAAHTEVDIATTLSVAQIAFRRVRDLQQPQPARL